MNNTAHPHQPSSRPAMSDKGIDWEPMPSLAYLIGRVKTKAHADEPVWAETMPASLDALAPSDPFVEALPGMVLREVTEPDIFKLFFDC